MSAFPLSIPMDQVPRLFSTVGGLFGLLYLDAKYSMARETYMIYSLLRSLKLLKTLEYSSDSSHVVRLVNNAKRYPKKVFLVCEDKIWTYEEFNKEVNRMAHYLRDGCNVRPNDVVSLFMENCPDFLIALFAIGKCGAIASLINYNLRDKPLLHCLTITNGAHILYHPSLVSAVQPISAELLKRNVQFIAYSKEPIPSAESLLGSFVNDDVLSKYSDMETDKKWRKCKHLDTACFIFTSGTTGLPKAAVIPHVKLWGIGQLFSDLGHITKEDRVYIALPLYHTNAVGIGVGMALSKGGSILLSRKFSVSKFWEECHAGEATAMMYIGELCRYLLSRPQSPKDREHKVRTAIGNGLRPEIWEDFKTRFNIPRVGEFYGATEGTVALFNYNTNNFGAGAVGHMGRVLSISYAPKIIEIDPITEDPVRNKNGYCVQCPYGKAGEMIAKIDDRIATSQFKGYYGNKSANEKKLLRDVFTKGDAYFRTGDLLKKDKDGFYYFVDRLGDTFRWKGENVSTAEVGTIVASFPGISEATIYGTLVPDHDGRAGMAAIVVDPSKFDMNEFPKYLLKQLPRYAVPVFIRFLEKLETTGTFKHQKVKLRNEGIEVAEFTDKVFMLDFKESKFKPFTTNELAAIKRGEIKI
ncbi:hypothetical protein BKA69DRAFT_1104278 [Paraphysoderma sedebokerense]|nr:hypothetical protein BKA69DRAFT_1104278 [Paraphysoderma sedebokerense]